MTERLRPLRRQGKPTFRSDPPCKQKQTTPEDFQQLPMTIKYLPQQHEIRAIEMKHTPEGHYIKTTGAVPPAGYAKLCSDDGDHLVRAQV